MQFLQIPFALIHVLATVVSIVLMVVDAFDEFLELLLFLFICSRHEVSLYVISILFLSFYYGCPRLNIICLWFLLHCQTIEFASIWLLARYYLVFTFFQLLLLLPEGLVLLP